jgi:hypothetical protein
VREGSHAFPHSITQYSAVEGVVLLIVTKRRRNRHQALRRELVGVNTKLRLDTRGNIRIYQSIEKHPARFEQRFSRCRGLLYFVACGVLDCCDGAEDAVENWRITASRNPSSFEHEGAFRSWLVRVLIDEALVILRRRSGSSSLSARKQDPSSE